MYLLKTGRYFLFAFTGLLAFFSGQLFAQKSSKVIVDSKTKIPLDYVFIQSDDARLKQLSDKDGRFIPISDSKIKAFLFYKMGYAKQTITAQNLLSRDTVFLKEQLIELNEVLITHKKIDTLVKDKRYYVDDYRVLPNGKFLLITSKINIAGFNVCYYDRAKGITHTYRIKNETDAHFKTDCFKNIHVVTADFSRQIFFASDSSFDFLPKYKRDVFESTLADCVLKMDTQLIMKYALPESTIHLADFDIKQHPPLLSYYRVSKHTRQPFYSVAYNARMREMIDHEIADWLLLYGAIDERIANNIELFFRKIAGPIYAPAFLKNDTVVVFNFQENTIVFLNKEGVILKSVNLKQDQFSTLHDFEIMYDGPAQKFYMKTKSFDRAFVKRLNIYSGSVEKNIKLEKVFAHNIQIVNDRIYYLVREKEWDDTEYLYLQN